MYKRQPETLIKEGHLDRVLRKAVSLGLNPITALKMVTINPARYFSLKGFGRVSPGYRASFVVLKDLVDFEVAAVFVDGRIVSRNGKLLERFSGSNIPKKIKSSLNLKPVADNMLRIKSGKARVRVIEIPNRERTEALNEKNGYLVPDLRKDILPLVVVERHKASGRIGKGFVSGFGLKRGALASTVAHDSHNIICVGANYEDMAFAIRTLKRENGGLVAVADRKVLGILELPVSGLMSDKTAGEVSKKLDILHRATGRLGCKLNSPFMELAFLALPVIPRLKLTDRGLVDVEKFRIVDVRAG